MESDAVELILANIRKSEVELIVSPTHQLELSAIRLRPERQYLLLLLEDLGTNIEFDMTAIRQRAEELVKKGLGVADAAHVAFAEFANADFVSVDDRLLKQCVRMELEIWSGSPLAYCDKEDLR